MDLQTLFYTIGIISMLLWIVIFVIILTTLIKIKNNVDNFKQGVRDRVINVAKERNVEIASALGLGIAHFVIDKIKKSRADKKAQES